MPGKTDLWLWAGSEVLLNILFQDVFGHAKRNTLWIEVFLFQVIAVNTVKVAERTCRLDKNLKISGR
jgi:hypothetical protein